MANQPPQSSHHAAPPEAHSVSSTAAEADTILEFMRSSALPFRDLALLQQALTHPSYRNEHPEVSDDNERLEFLGDAVIDFIAGELLYLRSPEMPEGDLTRLRAALVKTESLAEIGGRIGVREALRMGKGEEASGGRLRGNNVCAAFEAIIGALYLDRGMEAARTYVLPLLIDRLEAVQAAALDRDARSSLQEIAQARLGRTPRYEVVEQAGPDHDKEWTVVVHIGEMIAGRGIGKSKQAASQSAARDALARMAGP